MEGKGGGEGIERQGVQGGVGCGHSIFVRRGTLPLCVWPLCH